ncbi:type I toxin-antitoxin system SymE family toxin [Enterobacteriaceae bacterium H18W14]|uniref:SymE family type I addiction module toxin n=1 Tax=Dryocola boscaweniae TaxID=2925397 RepID=UPI0022F09AAE|nr:SymE family type I addiction module toxin [Dryocola boscaweniae]MCT4713917.1 type I toxin-antitoxin system SymE family toxin [Dryocola boscaweniae]
MKISKAQRRYKVGYLSVQRVKRATKMTTYYSRTPGLHLKGNWLAEAGFGTDTPVTIAVEHRQLVIRPLAE